MIQYFFSFLEPIKVQLAFDADAIKALGGGDGGGNGGGNGGGGSGPTVITAPAPPPPPPAPSSSSSGDKDLSSIEMLALGALLGQNGKAGSSGGGSSGNYHIHIF